MLLLVVLIKLIVRVRHALIHKVMTLVYMFIHTLKSQHSYVNIVFDRCDNGLSLKPAEIHMCRTSLHTLWLERQQHRCVNIEFDPCDNGLSFKPAERQMCRT